MDIYVLVNDGYFIRDIMVTHAPHVKLVFPSGNPDNNHLISLYAGIRDRFEAETMVFVGNLTVSLKN